MKNFPGSSQIAGTISIYAISSSFLTIYSLLYKTSSKGSFRNSIAWETTFTAGNSLPLIYCTLVHIVIFWKRKGNTRCCWWVVSELVSHPGGEHKFDSRFRYRVKPKPFYSILSNMTIKLIFRVTVFIGMPKNYPCMDALVMQVEIMQLHMIKSQGQKLINTAVGL